MNLIVYIVWLVVIFIDSLSKYLAHAYLVWKTNIIWSYLYLQYVENEWIAFSLPLKWIVLKIVTIILIFWIIYYYRVNEWKKRSLMIDVIYGCILWWAISNAIGRIFFWKVSDFIGIKFFSVFNIADMFISGGVIFYIAYLMVTKD